MSRTSREYDICACQVIGSVL